jgi:polycystin 1L2
MYTVQCACILLYFHIEFHVVRLPNPLLVDDSIIYLEDSATDTPVKRDEWVLGLSSVDRKLLLGQNMLNDLHISAAQTLLRKKFSNFTGFQLSLLGQVNKLEPVTSPSAQIHHDGGLHWFASANIGQSVYLMDSLAKDTLNTSTQLQLASIYKDHAVNNVLAVTRLPVQQQSGGVDCGLFSIAFLYTICSASKDYSHYDQSKMRLHLATCFNSRDLQSFPTTAKASGKCKKKVFKIHLYCQCRMPECMDNMVQCDMCHKWYHFKCVGWKSGI